MRALSFEDLCQLASLQGIFLSWSRSCTYCLGSLSERCLLQRIGKPVKFFSLMGSFGARITWFQPSFSYNQSPTGRKNKDKKKKGGERGKRGARRKACLFKQPQLPPTVSQQQRQSALQISYAVPGPSSEDVWGLLPALLGKAKSTRACFRDRFKPHICSPSSVRAMTLNAIWPEPGKLPPIRCSLQKNPIYFPALLQQ